jgi:ABC-type branched-subunit amino acid transport system substrate-binding protein
MSKVLRALAVLAAFTLVAAACRTEGGPLDTVGVENQTIKIGQLATLTGPVAVIGEPLLAGHEVYFQYVNEVLGGVGRDLPEDERYQIELVVRDNQYTSTVQRTQYGALRDEVLLIAQSLGTPTTQAIIDQVNRDGIMVGAATLATQWLSEPHVIPAGAPYPVQFINAAEYVVNEQGVTPRAGIIYQDDEYGEEGVDGLEFAAEELGFEIVARAAYEEGDTEFITQVQAMAGAEVDHVFLAAVPSAAGPILGTAAAAGYAPRWIGLSPVWIGAFLDSPELTAYMSQTLWVVTDAACEWGDVSEGCEGMAEMLENLERFAPDQEPDYYYAFGYTQARIVHQILEQAIANDNLTRSGVREAFESLRDVDMGGLLNPISYGPDCEDKIPATGSNILRVDPENPIGLSPVAEVESPTLDDFPFC